MRKKAIITGITGQDGPYLAELLLSKGYEVAGIYRRTSPEITRDLIDLRKRMEFIEGDVTDAGSLERALREFAPNEVYNLAGQSFVPASWTQPHSTMQINALGVLNILEAIRNINPGIRFYQASTSEMFGKVRQTPQNEETPFYPRSPYGLSKVSAFWMTKNYRESYGLHASNGILFNHESPRRGKLFVTRKITDSVARIKLGLLDQFEIGNLDAKRDWGFAGDYVEAMWSILQQDQPDDYVIGTGVTHSVRDFINASFGVIGKKIVWVGEGLDEVGKCDGQIVVRVNPKLYRPAEVDLLLADPSKARSKLGWEPKTPFDGLVKLMVENDLDLVKREILIKNADKTD